VTLTFDLESGAHYCSWGGQSSYQFWSYYRTFRSRLIGQHLSDASRDLATLTFDFEGHGALVADAVSVFRLCTKFEVRRPSRSEDIGHLLREHYSVW